MPDVLVVDDDVESRDLLQRGLEGGGHRVNALGTRAELLSHAETRRFHVVLLATTAENPPHVLCSELRKHPSTRALPVLVIPPCADETARVTAFEAGADDVVVRPFSMRELCLRIRVLAERRQQKTNRFEYGALTVDFDSHRAFVDGVEVSLTKHEFLLLAAFCREPDSVLAREAILQRVWQKDADASERLVDAYVCRLKVKLGRAGRYVRSIRRKGYCLDSYRRAPR
jgi:two-component system phosphate regulon response regulator PhoB